MADLNLSASPSSGGEKSKTPAPKGPTTGTPKLRMSPAGDHSPVSRTAGAIVGVVSVVALALAIFLSNPSAPTTQGTGTGTGTTASSVTPTGHTTRVSVGVDGMAFTPNHIEVPVGDRLIIDFTNSGDQRHDLVFETGVSSGSLAAGETKELDLGVISGDVEGWCSLPGHREMGMTLHVKATGTSSSSSGSSASGSHAHHGHDHGQDAAAGPATPTALTDYAATIDARDPVLPPATNEDRAPLHLHGHRADRQRHELADARVVDLQRGRSRADPARTHRRHLPHHARQQRDDEPLTGLPRGPRRPRQRHALDRTRADLEYTFIAKNAGIWLYHCSTAPMSMHIANGMFGAVIIDPTDLDKVDHEYVMVASELYLGADGQPADASLLSALQPNAMAFNGVPFQYKAHPIQIKTNERVRVWVMDAGPNLATTFHVVGTQFDTVWREGAYVIRGGGSGGGWGQVLTLGAAEGGFVEFTPLEPATTPSSTTLSPWRRKARSASLR